MTTEEGKLKVDGIDGVDGLSAPEVAEIIASTTDVVDDNLARAAEREKLSHGFSLDALLRNKRTAALHVKSRDPELGLVDGGRENRKMPDEFLHLREGRDMLNFMNTPSTDFFQIRQRQEFIQSLIGLGNFDRVLNAKRQSYAISDGIDKIYSTMSAEFGYSSQPCIRIFRGEVQSDSVAEATKFVYQGIAMIETGQTAMRELMDILTESGDPFLTEICSSIRKDYDRVKVLTRELFVSGDYESANPESLGMKHEDFTHQYGMFIEYAAITKKDGYSRGTSDRGKPYSYQKGWNFFRAKNGGERDSEKFEPQVLNDSPSDEETSVFVGPGMSGKTFLMKQSYWMKKCFQSFGWVPCESGNFRVSDGIFYLDRASTDAESDLSAYGVDIVEIIDMISKLGNNSEIFLDERLSTTSGAEQFYLLAALILFLMGKRARVHCAVHNEALTQWVRENPNIGLYYFQTDVDEGGDVEWTHRLKRFEGSEDDVKGLDARSIDVAQKLGLDQGLIDIARQFLAGEVTPVEFRERAWPKLDRMSDAERGRLKKGSATFNTLFTVNRTQDRLFTALSVDGDFAFTRYNGGRICGATDGLSASSTMKVLKYNLSRMRAHLVHSFFFDAAKLSPAEVLERQKTFSALLEAPDRFSDVVKMEETLALLVKCYPDGFHRAREHMASFNLALNPFRNHRHSDFNFTDGRDTERVMDMFWYLDMNKELLGDRFPFDAEYEKLRQKYAACMEPFNEVANEVDIRDLDGNAFDERSVAIFKQFAEKFGEDDSERWGEKITYERVKALYARCRRLSPDDRSRFELQDLSHLENRLNNAIEGHPNVVDAYGDFETFYRKMHILVSYEMPALPLQNCDIDVLRKYVAPYAEAFRQEALADKVEIDENHSELTSFWIFADWLLNSNNVAKGMVDLLKSYDSVHTHQLANELDRRFQDYFKCGASYDSRGTFCRGVSLPAEFAELRALQDEYAEVSRDIGILFNRGNGAEGYLRMFKMRDGIDRFMSDGTNVDAGLSVIKFMEMMVNSDSYYDLHSVNDKPEGKYYSEYFRRMNEGRLSDWRERRTELTAEFIENEIMADSESPCAKAYTHFSMQLDKLKSIGSRLERLRKSMKIEFPDNGGRRMEKYYEAVRLGNVPMIINSINEMLKKKVSDSDWRGGLNGNDHEKLDAVQGSIGALFSVAHLLRENEFCEVLFNEDGEISIEQAWSLFKPKGEQTHNDFKFAKGEALKFLASPNMSGKTFAEKLFVMFALASMTTGFGPAMEATLPFLNPGYMDRVVAKDGMAKSSSADEVAVWKKFFESCMSNDTFLVGCFDEIFSTIPVEYRAAFTFAVAVRVFLSAGNKGMIASHDRNVVDKLIEMFPEAVKGHHFEHRDEVGEDGVVRSVPTYKMVDNPDVSRAIDVAERLGFPEEILSMARALKDSCE